VIEEGLGILERTLGELCQPSAAKRQA
jgi:hypothetical protein